MQEVPAAGPPALLCTAHAPPPGPTRLLLIIIMPLLPPPPFPHTLTSPPGVSSLMRRIPGAGRLARKLAIQGLHRQMEDILAVLERVKGGQSVEGALAEAAAERRAASPSQSADEEACVAAAAAAGMHAASSGGSGSVAMAVEGSDSVSSLQGLVGGLEGSGEEAPAAAVVSSLRGKAPLASFAVVDANGSWQLGDGFSSSEEEDEVGY